MSEGTTTTGARVDLRCCRPPTGSRFGSCRNLSDSVSLLTSPAGAHADGASSLVEGGGAGFDKASPASSASRSDLSLWRRSLDGSGAAALGAGWSASAGAGTHGAACLLSARVRLT
eukprot:4368572-Prymnesium_polylepis.1